MSSRYLRLLAVIAFMFTSGASLACTAGAKGKSTDGSLGATAPTSSSSQKGG